MKKKSKSISVVILVGGFGTRLRPVVVDLPKTLAPIGNSTILDLILKHIFQFEFKEIVLSVGHMGDSIKAYMENYAIPEGVSIKFSEEESPLGTGGAILNSFYQCTNDKILILNGDTFFPIDYEAFINKHTENKAEISIALYRTEKANNSGLVSLDSENRIISFKEKDNNTGGFINTGTYLLQKNILVNLDLPTEFSIERDFFEKYLDIVDVRGFLFNSYFIDIGTPESYKRAQNDLFGYNNI